MTTPTGARLRTTYQAAALAYCLTKFNYPPAAYVQGELGAREHSERDATELAAEPWLQAVVDQAVQHLTAENARLRQALADSHTAHGTALTQRDEARNFAAAAEAHHDAHAYEVRLICDALDIPIPETADPIIAAIQALKAKIQP